MTTHTRWDLTLTVHGTPAGQGRVSFLGRGRAIHTNHARLQPWRDAITIAARAEIARLGGGLGEGPVETDLTVTVPKPKGAPKRRRTWPVTRSSTDLDHHARAIHDALSKAGVFGDDSQVVQLTARKVYPGEHELALAEPGAVVRVRSLAAVEVA